MEIMLNILFFSILIAFCLQLFFRAHSLSESTSSLHRAVSICSSLAEIYQSSTDGKEAIKQHYPDFEASKDALLIYFDEDFVHCPQKDAAYYAKITFFEDAQKSAELCFCRSEDSRKLYMLDVSGYRPLTVTELTGGDQP